MMDIGCDAIEYLVGFARPARAKVPLAVDKISGSGQTQEQQ